MGALRMSKSAHDKLLAYVEAIQDKQKDFSEFRDKLTAIDEAYAKSRLSTEDEDDCKGQNSTVSSNEAIKVPIVNSEIDSIVGTLTKIFINRTPLFPVMSDSRRPEIALHLQALISKDARQQRWGRQLLNFITKAVRYNIQAIEVEQTTQKDFDIATSDDVDADVEFEDNLQPVVRLFTTDMYNTLFDYRVAPADIHIEGEYAGYNKMVAKTWLQARGLELSDQEIAYNLRDAYESKMEGIDEYYFLPPEVATITPMKPEDKKDWFDWLGITKQKRLGLDSSSYFYTKLYARIIPADFGLAVESKPNTPRIVRLEIINMKHIISYKEIVTPLNMLPILFSDLREDGLEYQTKSPGEAVSPFQDVATELLYSRLEGSKRALSDRAIYNNHYLSETDVNAPFAAAKIPFKSKLRNMGEMPQLNQLYYPIPFEGQGVINSLTDLSTIMQLKDEVNGTNYAVRGEQRPGNRTLGEHSDLSSAGRDKGMPYAIRIEEQIMIPTKRLIKFFILSSTRVEREILDVDSETLLTVNIAELRKAMLDFRLTDGLRPKQAIRDPQALSTAIQFVQNNPELSATHDTGGIFADLMAQWDIDISKHRRKNNESTPGQPSTAVQPSDTNT